MKTNSFKLLVLTLSLFIFGFTALLEIPECCTSYQGTKTIVAGKMQKTAIPKPYKVRTGKGDHELSAAERSSIIYTNSKNAAFIDLHVEESLPKHYNKDTLAVINNLKYQMAHGKNFENSNLIELNFNGSKIYGFSHSVLDKDSILSRFAIFPGNSTIVYINFFSSKPEERTYTTVGDYRIQRNAFLGNYTAHLRRCITK